MIPRNRICWQRSKEFQAYEQRSQPTLKHKSGNLVESHFLFHHRFVWFCTPPPPPPTTVYLCKQQQAAFEDLFMFPTVLGHHRPPPQEEQHSIYIILHPDNKLKANICVLFVKYYCSRWYLLGWAGRDNKQVEADIKYYCNYLRKCSAQRRVFKMIPDQFLRAISSPALFYSSFFCPFSYIYSQDATLELPRTGDGAGYSLRSKENLGEELKSFLVVSRRVS